MPQPTASDLHVDALLTQVALAWFQQADPIAFEMAPLVPVSKQSDRYRVWSLPDLTRIVAEVRGDGAEAASGGFGLSNESYFAIEYAVKTFIGATQRANDDLGDLDQVKAKWVARQLKMKLESVWGAAAFVTGIWDTEVVGTTDFVKWDVGGSTPIDDMLEQLDAVEELTGYRPNVIGFGSDVSRVVLRHPDVIELINAGQTPGGPAVAMNESLARILTVDKVITARMMNTTSNEGAATDTAARILDTESVLAVYRPASPSLEEPSAMYSFAWSGLLGSEDGMRVRNYRDEAKGTGGSDVIEGEAAWDTKVTSTALGVLFRDCIT